MSEDGCRIHFWFLGVPEDREGGPWWSRTFYDNDVHSAARQRKDFYQTLRPFLHAAAFSDRRAPVQDAPPEGAELLDVKAVPRG